MIIKFRKFWKRNPAEQIHSTKKQQEVNITDDDMRVYIKCSRCKEGRVITVTISGAGRKMYGTKLCPVCHGLGKIDSGRKYKVNKEG